MKAGYKQGELAAIEKVIDKLSSQDAEYPEALFARASLLKKEMRLEEAANGFLELLASYQEFPQKSQALFELIDIEYQNTHWKSCRAHAKQFLEEFPSHDLAAAAWRYLASASGQLSAAEALDQRSQKKQFAADLERLFKNNHLFSPDELSDWQFHLAKTYYEIHDYKKAYALLEPLLKEGSFPELANSYLLMALLQKDRSTQLFCSYAEKALDLGANLVDSSQVHIALFNAYLEQSETHPELLEKAADHLFVAFSALSTLQTENLDWLTAYYYSRADENKVASERAIKLLESSAKTPLNSYHLARLYSQHQRIEEQVAILEPLKNELDLEAKLLLAEGYARLEKRENAIELFDAIVAASPTTRNLTSASASLQAIRLKRAQGTLSFEQAANGLKNLILQRRLANEPIHLEAALEYIALQSENDPAKRAALLKKTKADFESTEDLLSNDYQQSRAKLVQKNHIYEMYLRFFDADVCLCEAILAKDPLLQKHWEAKAKEILTEILSDPVGNTLLKDRIGERLKQLQIDESNV